MMAWGRKERSAWQSEPAASIKSSNVPSVFLEEKYLGGVGGAAFCSRLSFLPYPVLHG